MHRWRAVEHAMSAATLTTTLVVLHHATHVNVDLDGIVDLNGNGDLVVHCTVTPPEK